jgi:hypothetical protein
VEPNSHVPSAAKLVCRFAILWTKLGDT